VAVLSSQQNIRLEAFGDASPGAGAAVPLRSVRLGTGSAAGRAGILAFLDAQQGDYRPATVTSGRDPSGQPAVTVRFGVPGPLSTP
jgi:hypothetical protein